MVEHQSSIPIPLEEGQVDLDEPRVLSHFVDLHFENCWTTKNGVHQLRNGGIPAYLFRQIHYQMPNSDKGVPAFYRFIPIFEEDQITSFSQRYKSASDALKRD